MATGRADSRIPASTVEIAPVKALGKRVEPVLLAVFARWCVHFMSWDQALRLFNRFPARRHCRPTVSMPVEADFRGAGACLARTLARSQYLRQRGVSSVIVIGATGASVGSNADFSLDAHAWLDVLDDSPAHAVLHRIER